CNTACAGQCAACNLAGKVGTCSAETGAPVGGRAACAGTGTTCGGTCDGINTIGCAFPSAATSCRTASCTNGVATAAAGCNGAGACPAAMTTQCSPYICGATACLTSCTSSAQCTAGRTCLGGQCVAQLANGAACVASTECV